jgi:hypothetical protein
MSTVYPSLEASLCTTFISVAVLINSLLSTPISKQQHQTISSLQRIHAHALLRAWLLYPVHPAPGIDRGFVGHQTVLSVQLPVFPSVIAAPSPTHDLSRRRGPRRRNGSAAPTPDAPVRSSTTSLQSSSPLPHRRSPPSQGCRCASLCRLFCGGSCPPSLDRQRRPDESWMAPLGSSDQSLPAQA